MALHNIKAQTPQHCSMTRLMQMLTDCYGLMIQTTIIGHVTGKMVLKKMVPGPIFSLKISVRGLKFSEKIGPPLNISVRLVAPVE